MIRHLIAAWLALSVTVAWAATPEITTPDITEKRPNTVTSPTHFDNPDDLGDGFIADMIATRDSDKFERNIMRAGAMVHYESIYDFIAIGASRNEFKQGNWSYGFNSLVGAIRKVDRATAEGITARVAVAFTGNTPKLHGEGTWNIRFADSTGIELIANRDAVESMLAIQQGIMSNFVAVSLDHALTERLTVIGMPTYRSFSDGNDQKGFRAWLIYALLPEYGLSAQLKYREYESSQTGNGAYFSPERYERAEIGLRLRRSFGDWRVFATADYGRERIDSDIEKPASQVALTAQRSFANNASLGAQFVYYRSSDAPGNVPPSGNYSWRMARLTFTIPF